MLSGGSRWLSALPTGSKWVRALPGTGSACLEHVLDEYAVAGFRVGDQHVGDRAGHLAVLQDGAAAHE